MKIVCIGEAREDDAYRPQHDDKMVDRINELIKNGCRDAFKGIGKPEPLKNELRGFWSRRITREHRLVYTVSGNTLQIIQCRMHY